MSAEVNVLPFHVINWTGKVRKPAALLWPCESCRCQKMRILVFIISGKQYKDRKKQYKRIGDLCKSEFRILFKNVEIFYFLIHSTKLTNLFSAGLDTF